MEENKFKKMLFNEISLVIAVASFVFWFLNFFSSPITQMQLDIAIMQKDISSINEKHSEYAQNANDRDRAIIELNKNVALILQRLGK